MRRRVLTEDDGRSGHTILCPVVADAKFTRSKELAAKKAARKDDAEALCADATLLPYPCTATDFDDMVQQNFVGPRGVVLTADELATRKEDANAAGSIVSKGMYAKQLAGWLEAGYPRDALLVVLFERFYSSGITKSMNEITRFLGVPDHEYEKTAGHTLYQRYNSFQRHRRNDRDDMLPSTRKILDDIFCEPNKELEALISYTPTLQRPRQLALDSTSIRGEWSQHSARTLQGAGYSCVE